MKHNPTTLPPAFLRLSDAEAFIQQHPGHFLITSRHAESCPRAERDAAQCTCQPWYVPMTPDECDGSSCLATPGRPPKDVGAIIRRNRR